MVIRSVRRDPGQKNCYLVDLEFCNINRQFLICDSTKNYKEIPFGFSEAILGDCTRVGMSGCKDFEFGHITMSGKFQYSKPILIPQNLRIKIENSDNYDQIFIWREINKHSVEIVKRFIDSAFEKEPIDMIKEDWGPFTHLKPLMIKYISNKIENYPDGLIIEEIPYSWTAIARFGNIEVKIPKTKRELTNFDDYYVISLTQIKAIYYKFQKQFERRILYYRIGRRIIGFEENFGRIQPYCEITADKFEFHEKDYFNSRLGDALFIKEEILDKHYERIDDSEEIPEFIASNKIANSESDLRDYLYKNGNSEYYLYSDDSVILKHYEHGFLILNPGLYRIEKINYIYASD
jgi:hypothetical protein